MKEQDAAHSFEKEDDDIRGHHEPDDRPQSMIDLAEKIKLEEQLKLSELTRLRSELQDTKSYYEDKLDARQRTIDQQFSELQQKGETIKELVNVAARISIQLKKGDSYRVHIESLIKKANVF